MKERCFDGKFFIAAFIACLFSGFASYADDVENAGKSFPFSELGQKAAEKSGPNSLGLKAIDNGAEIVCKLQAIEALVTVSGISIKSTSSADGVGTFSMKVAGLGRTGHRPSQVSSGGNIKVSKDCVQIICPELVEEYTVSGDGIRQDFIISKKPEGNGTLALAIGISGATSGLSGTGLKIRLSETGREFAYSKLLVTDSTGRKLPAEFKITSPDKFYISINDANATYPVRIDPTISDNNWVSMGGLSGTNGNVSSIAVDSLSNLYIGGSFTISGDAMTNYIAKWNGSKWSAVGGGMDDPVTTIAFDSSDNLYAGGSFTAAGGVTANRIAKWDGSAWSALGTGMNGGVSTLAFDGSGNLYAGGSFTAAGGVPANRIAKWDGSAWSALGTGMNGGVSTLAFDGSGNLYAGGYFTSAGKVFANSIAKWDGSKWNAVGTGLNKNSFVNALSFDSIGNLYAGGNLSSAYGGSNNYIAKWDGSQWHSMGEVTGSVSALSSDSSGNLYAGGQFTAVGGVSCRNLAKLDGLSWSAFSVGDTYSSFYVSALLHDSSGNLYVGGYFNVGGQGVWADNITKWDGTAWSALGGINEPVNALVFDSSGNLYAGGWFTDIDGIAVNHIAKWDGSAWSALGTGMGREAIVSVLALDSSGNLYVGGDFTTADGILVKNIAKWDGNKWSALGSGMMGIYADVHALAFDSSGNLYAGGGFTTAGGVLAKHIAKWNGTAWSALGSGIGNSTIYSDVGALAFDSFGNLYAGGIFAAAGGVLAYNIAKWDGSAWSALGAGINGTVHSLSFDSSGNLYAGGSFTTADGVMANNIARWNGTTWNALGSGTNNRVRQLSFDTSGNLYAGGSFTTAGGVSANNIARWNGATWNALGSGTNNPVRSIAIDSSDNLYVGGEFKTAGGKNSVNLAKLVITPNLTMSVSGNGSTSPSIGSSSVNKATAIPISAIAQCGYHFVNWTKIGNAVINDLNASSTTVSLAYDAIVTANFEINTYSVVFTSGANGSISGNKNQTVNHAANCTKVTSMPDANYHFTGWTGDHSGIESPLALTNISENMEVTANFARNTATLAVNKSGNGTAEFTGINPMKTFTAIPITANAAENNHFVKWTVASGSATIASPTAASTTVTMTGGHASEVTINANFAINTYSVVFTASANGFIGGTKTQTVNHAANCTQVTAAPEANYRFTGWTGYYTGVDNPLTITNVTENKAITANFAHNTATLTLNAIGNGTAGFSGVNPLGTGTATPILATAAANNHFVNWTITSGSAIIVNAKSVATTVMLTGDHGSSATITANFAEDAAPTVVPAAPVISATDGTYEDRIIITWKAVPTATSYEVYRNTTNLTPVPNDKLGEVTDTIFEDNTAEYGTTYFYFAKANNSIGSSVKFSIGNSGYVAKAPAVPGSVVASDGTYFDKIRVSWAKVAGATSYLVFRTNTATPAPNPNLKTDLIGETTALFLDDFGDDIVPQFAGEVKKYHYWIAAKNGNATTVISKPNDGYLSNKGPATVTASNGTYSNRIVVTWTAVPGATAYDVYSYTDSKYALNKTKVGDTVEALEYECIPIATDTPFYYRVNAKYALGLGSYDSALSLAGAVGKASGNSNPTATNINNGATSSNIVDMEKGSVIYFSTEVLFGTTRLVATLDGTGKLITNDCNVFAKFANYPTLALYNAKDVENNVNEILTVSNPAAGTWYFMLYGVTAYSDVTLTVNSYAVADIVLTQIPVNDLPVPFTAIFKGKVVDEAGSGIPNIVVQTRNPITGLTSSLTKTDARGIFSYSVLINSEGEHTFDFFFSEMPDPAKGTASHTVATRKGCFVEEPNNFFDFSAYLPATPIAVPLHADVIGLQNFLDTRNGWDENTINGTYATLWVNSTLVKARDDAQFAAKLDDGLYILLYGVEGAAVGNDTTTTPALSAVPLVVHVENSKKGDVLTALNTLGVISGPQKTAIEGGSGIIAVAPLSDPDEGLTPKSISLLACEQLELLAKLAAGTGISSDAGTYSGVPARKVTLTLAGRKINVVAAGFVK